MADLVTYRKAANFVRGLSVRGGSEIISSDAVYFSIYNFVAGRDEWVLPDKKIIPGLYIIVRLGTIFWFGSGQSPGVPEILLIRRYILIYRNRTNIKNIMHERRKLYDTG